MEQIEKERVFLVKGLPKDIINAKHIIIKVGDFFDPNKPDALKIKQKGDKYFLIKKHGKSARHRIEHGIDIKKGEFDILWKSTIQNHEKLRLFYPLGKYLCEIDFYLGRLYGYVRAEVEFKDNAQMKAFDPPAWFGDEITRYNHSIHGDLGIVTFADMKKRYTKKNIILKRMSLPKGFGAQFLKPR